MYCVFTIYILPSFVILLLNINFQPQVGLIPWGPVYDRNFTIPRDNWYEGWREKDWRFMSSLPEDQIRRGEFDRGLSYMTGVTTQEAAHYVCEYWFTSS